MKTVFFDIETLSTEKRAVVLSFGAIVVNLEEPKSYLEMVASGVNVKFNAKEQIEQGRHVQQGCLDFWQKQSAEAQKCLVPSDQDILVEDFYEAIKPLGYVQDATWYCKGPHFDGGIMEDLFETNKMMAPWGYSNMRDVRTALEWTTGSTQPYDRPDGFVNHDPVHDAAYDAWAMFKALNGDPCKFE